MDKNESTMPAQFPQNRWLNAQLNATEFEAARAALIPTGPNEHGEANFVMRLRSGRPLSVLDAGCGAGRMAIELARQDVEVVGVDVDPQMLAFAQQKAPMLRWQVGDISTIDLERRFDIIVMAGNVMIVVTPGTETAIVANLARHLNPEGLLIAGFATDRSYYSLAQYDAAGSTVGLVLVERWATWECEPWRPEAPFTVSVHRAPSKKERLGESLELCW